MIIAILFDEFPDGFSADDIVKKTSVVRDGWGAECKSPLGDASHRVTYALPDRKTVRNAIKDYLERPSVYPKGR